MQHKKARPTRNKQTKSKAQLKKKTDWASYLLSSLGRWANVPSCLPLGQVEVRAPSPEPSSWSIFSLPWTPYLSLALMVAMGEGLSQHALMVMASLGGDQLRLPNERSTPQNAFPTCPELSGFCLVGVGLVSTMVRRQNDSAS